MSAPSSIHETNVDLAISLLRDAIDEMEDQRGVAREPTWEAGIGLAMLGIIFAAAGKGPTHGDIHAAVRRINHVARRLP